MPKIKTHKATAKRFKITKPKKSKGRKAKILKRGTGLSHFNARETGRKQLKKKRIRKISENERGTIKKLIHNNF